MLIILSQKLDSKSSYSDELFNSYHYPARYKNQIHEGDTFIYYQGNRYDRSHRYYFGIGKIGEILTTDGKNYYAKLLNCQRFEKNVSIYLPDGGYIEQLGYETVRNSINPPWQSSVRPISQVAFDYILNAAGVQATPEKTYSIDGLNAKLKKTIREYFLDGDATAIYRIESIAAAIGRATDIADKPPVVPYVPSESGSEKLLLLLDYCKTMRMTYSYKPVLILALLHAGKQGSIHIETAATYFRTFYNTRREQGLPVEKRRCIYLKDHFSNKEIIANLIANPVKALCESGFFYYNEDQQIFSLSPEIWAAADKGGKSKITKICNHRIKEYFGS